MGLIVANMGIQSLRTMDYADLTKYVRSLVSLALLSVCVRVLWVVDMILQVQHAVEESQENEGKEDPAEVDDREDEEPLDSKTVISFGIQVNFVM